jgi:uncharacterized protein
MTLSPHLPRAVIDPNIYVAAVIKPDGTCGQVIDAINEDRLVAIACPLLLKELRGVLLRPKLRRWVTGNGALAFWRAVRARAEVLTDPYDPAPYTRDPADYLIALGVAGHADAVVSGDADLTTAVALPLPVWTPSEALRHVAG